MRTPTFDQPYTRPEAIEFIQLMAQMNPEGTAILNHADHTPNELAIEVMQMAFNLGWADGEAADAMSQFQDDPERETLVVGSYGEHSTSAVLADIAFDASDSAVDYLNELVQHANVPFLFENNGEAGAFVLVPNPSDEA